MCGIIGIMGRHEKSWARSMLECMVHRGPDDHGIFHDASAHVSLGMRRLSIQDLACGHQPMSNKDGSITLVFNGEIYNAPELREALKKKGQCFQTHHSDTEVLLKLYESEGKGMLQKINGMFAFLIWDRAKKEIFGARDRIGIKPLYYIQHGGAIAFASELKCLLPLPLVHREVNRQSLFHYFTLMYIPGQPSILKNIFRVPPGHCFTYNTQNSRLDMERYWDITFQEEKHSVDDWQECIRELLTKSVEQRMLSDVPVGFSLSGGLDSGGLVGLLAKRGFSKIKTYSLGFEGKEAQFWDELPLANKVAEKWGTEHCEFRLAPDTLLKDLLQMVWHLDEPYGGGLPAWYVFREMRREVTVGITGSGGDELFGNYGKYVSYENSRLLQFALCLKMPWAKKLVEFLSRNPDAARAGSWLRVFRLLGYPFGRAYYANNLYFSDDLKRSFVLQNTEALSDTAEFMQDVFERCPSQGIRNALLAVDMRTQLPDEFLFMTDRFSMAHSLEARVPFLDHTLVEAVCRMPANLRTRSGEPKYFLKDLLRGVLPSELMESKKRGFVLPVELWLRRELKPLVKVMLDPHRLSEQRLMRPDFYARYFIPHLEGKKNYTWQIWSALMFQLWHFLFIERCEKNIPRYTWRDICA